VSQAKPHLGEVTQGPWVVWLVLGGLALVLVIIGVSFATRISSTASAPMLLPSLTANPAPSPSLGLSIPAPLPTPRPSTATYTPIPATSTRTPRPTAAFIRYQFRSGDTLSEIAERYRVTVRAIMLANDLEGETIRVGQELIIPRPTPHP
jgi:LysM repeat protein